MSDAQLKTMDVRARIEPELKASATRILSDCGLTLSDAFRLFLRQVVAHQGLPFEVLSPTRITAAAAQEARQTRNRRFATAKDLFDELDRPPPRQARKSAKKK